MEFLKLAAERYSVRKFKNEHLDKDIIDSILKAAMLAPTGCNNQPFRILVLNTDEAIRKLKPCTKCHFDAPTAFLICSNRDECWTRPYDGAACGVVDASIVTTHMMLQAHSIGVGTTWVMHFNPFIIREAFSIPEKLEPVALLVAGIPADDAMPSPLHSTFRDADSLIVYDSF